MSFRCPRLRYGPPKTRHHRIPLIPHMQRRYESPPTAAKEAKGTNFLLPSLVIVGMAGLGLAYYYQNQKEEQVSDQEGQKVKGDEILFPTVLEIQGPMRGKEVPPRKGTLYDDVILTIDRKTGGDQVQASEAVLEKIEPAPLPSEQSSLPSSPTSPSLSPSTPSPSPSSLVTSESEQPPQPPQPPQAAEQQQQQSADQHVQQPTEHQPEQQQQQQQVEQQVQQQAEKQQAEQQQAEQVQVQQQQAEQQQVHQQAEPQVQQQNEKQETQSPPPTVQETTAAAAPEAADVAISSSPSSIPSIPSPVSEAFQSLLAITLTEQRRQNEEQVVFVNKFLEELHGKEIEERESEWKKREEMEGTATASKLEETEKKIEEAEVQYQEQLGLYTQALENEVESQRQQWREKLVSEGREEIEQTKEKLVKGISSTNHLAELDKKIEEINNFIEEHKTKQLHQICLNVVRLRKVLDGGGEKEGGRRRGFHQEVEELKKSFGGNGLATKVLDSIPVQLQEEGVASLPELKEAFAELTQKVEKVSYIPNDGGLLWVLFSQMASFVLPSGLVVNETKEVLKRAGMKLDRSEVVDAMKEIDRLGESAVGVMFEEWKKKASERVLVEMALENLVAEAKFEMINRK